jgi:hypothetical protein
MTHPVGENFPRRGVVLHNVNSDVHLLLIQLTPKRLFCIVVTITDKMVRSGYVPHKGTVNVTVVPRPGSL